MSSKIYQRIPAIWHSILFCVLSLVFCYLCYAFVHEVSAFNSNTFKEIIYLAWPLLLLFLMCLFSLFFVKSFASNIYLFFLLVILSFYLYWLYRDWNHLVLLASGMYFVLAFMSWSNLSWTLSSPLYRGNYDQYSLIHLQRSGIRVSFYNGGKKYDGVVTDWSDEGIYIHYKGSLDLKDCESDIEFKYRNWKYDCKMRVTILEPQKNGMGLVSLASDQKWMDFKGILKRLGFSNHMLTV